MKPQSLVLILSASLALASAVSAKHGDTAQPAPQAAAHQPAVEMSVDDLVAGRRAGYWMSAGLFGGMFGVMNSGGDVKGLAFSARALAGWAKALPGMFPEGSVNEETNALPTVWSEREEFERIAGLYAERATSLADIAASGDADAFKAQWALVRETCSSCHDTFRRDRKKEVQAQN